MIQSPQSAKSHGGGCTAKHAGFTSASRRAKQRTHRGCNPVGYDFAQAATEAKICFVEIGPVGTSVDAGVVGRVSDLVRECERMLRGNRQLQTQVDRALAALG